MADRGPGNVHVPRDAQIYWELEAELAPEGEEIWSLFCHEQGALGAEILSPANGRRRVRYFFEHAPFPSPSAWRNAFARLYPRAFPPHKLTIRRHVAQPWEKAWQAHFQPFTLGRRLLICPPWDKGAEADSPRLRVVIEPGQGFGTGWHPSTALALLMVEALITEDHTGRGAAPPRMLDVGVGSGILSIAARLLGVGEAWGLDVDAHALPEVRRNFTMSGIDRPPRVVQGRPDCLRARFPLVVANITASVLKAHCHDLAALTEAGGWLILSGILETERSDVGGRFTATGMAVEREQCREGWYACRLRHP